MTMIRCFTILALAAGVETAAFSAETVNYSYDALGRLTTSATTAASTVNANVTASSVYDPAGNRSNYNVTGAATSSQAFQVVVLPISGFTIIPINPVN